jgi:hypothetical protein
MRADYLFLDTQPDLFVRRQNCRGLQTKRKLAIRATTIGRAAHPGMHSAIRIPHFPVSGSRRTALPARRLSHSTHSALAKFLSERY